MRGRKLTELSHASKTLLQHSGDVTEALRRIRSDESMTLEATRTALDAIIEMVGMQPTCCAMLTLPRYLPWC